MTATIFLLRHAAHDQVGLYLAGRTSGITLGVDGLAQAQRLGERMRREQFDALYSSPRERAQQTAEAVAAARGGMPVETVEALDEVDFGEWSGSTFDQLNTRPEWRHWNEQRSLAATPTGETMLDVQRRAIDVVRQLVAQPGDTRSALVSHADVIRAIVGHLLGLPIDAWQRFDISPASITTLVVGDWGSKLITLNEITP
ncbi:MAG TPA: histidine phosphatase family protein [Devosia sp.]|jgi:broad specificity phosphatase PhoE|uniref:histidine phosphatase family protein n=1 Tax=Devosia sp. TaxID=1871048 RepID=UPI002F91CD24